MISTLNCRAKVSSLKIKSCNYTNRHTNNIHLSGANSISSRLKFVAFWKSLMAETYPFYENL